MEVQTLNVQYTSKYWYIAQIHREHYAYVLVLSISLELLLCMYFMKVEIQEDRS